MPRHKIKWISSEDLPEKILDMVARFEQAFNTHTTGYTITNLLDYGVWFQCFGRCSAYSLAQLALNSPDCYVELIAAAPSYYIVAMWKSQDGQHGRAGCGIERARTPFDDEYQVTTKIRIRSSLID